MAVDHSTLQSCVLGGRVKTSVTILAAVMLYVSLPAKNPAPIRTWRTDGQTFSVHKPKRSGNGSDPSVQVPDDPRPNQGTGESGHSRYAMQRGGNTCEPRAPTRTNPTAQFMGRVLFGSVDARDEQVHRYHEQPTTPFRSFCSLRLRQIKYAWQLTSRRL